MSKKVDPRKHDKNNDTEIDFGIEVRGVRMKAVMTNNGGFFMELRADDESARQPISRDEFWGFLEAQHKERMGLGGRE